MTSQITALKSAIEPIRQQITEHQVYSAIRKPSDLRLFMQHHVYAVWDFMSLLKSLQINLTCTTVPWFPKSNADAGFLINEIVVGEETDVDMLGRRKSHFEMYIDAMDEAGADTSSIRQFIEALKSGSTLHEAFETANTPQAARAFVQCTFDIINSAKPHLQAAVFTFGREDLIPDMFLSMIRDLEKEHPLDISAFRYYLERHIDVDGGHHSQLALEMTAGLCGSDNHKWQEAQEASARALELRMGLWNGVYASILQHQNEGPLIAQQ
jgi:hypothetical protein